ncbi:MAG: DEAD/DEAH box helicase [Candidatus Eisenbacteria bacterium]|nr:DEAD/DEAH box helicase [Candidatus Eisenbacteria bacterium]
MNAVTDRSGFARFDFQDSILRGLDAVGFETPRTIQDETIPAALEGRDILGLAQTGTGKTAAFALPILSRLLDDRTRGPLALIVAPTRELALQITTEIRELGKYTPLKCVSIYGGSSMQRQIQALRQKPEIIVGCPGRLLDLVGQKKLDLRRVKTLVLDEADQMFDMGFLPDIKRIVACLPPRRQTMLFSATMPKQIRGLADELLETPHVVQLAHSAPPTSVDHALCRVEETEKPSLLVEHLRKDDCRSAIVFTRTKRRAQRIAERLEKAGFRATDLHGNLSQAQRDRSMRGFRDGKYNVLVATDVASRGIDVPNVSYVINYDVPSTPEAYTHRIGRTGRSTQTGIARTFVTGNDREWVRATERTLGMRLLHHGEPAEADRTETAPSTRPARSDRRDAGDARDNRGSRNRRDDRRRAPSQGRNAPRGRGYDRDQEQTRDRDQAAARARARARARVRDQHPSRDWDRERVQGGNRATASHAGPRRKRRSEGDSGPGALIQRFLPFLRKGAEETVVNERHDSGGRRRPRRAR